MTDDQDDAVRSPTPVVIVRGAQVLLTRETRGGLLGLPRGRAAKKTRGRDAVAHRATGKQLSSRVREAIARICTRVLNQAGFRPPASQGPYL